MKPLIAALAAGCALSANAQTVITITGASCNVAQTVCDLANDAGDDITFTYDGTGNVWLVVTSVNPDLTTSTTTYTGPIGYAAPTTNTLYRVVTPFAATLDPPAVLEGDRVRARSGSGRGGWAWHVHWDFDTLTIY